VLLLAEKASDAFVREALSPSSATGLRSSECRCIRQVEGRQLGDFSAVCLLDPPLRKSVATAGEFCGQRRRLGIFLGGMRDAKVQQG
jgi:hypothetical protein